MSAAMAITAGKNHLESRSSSSALALGFERLGLRAAVFSTRRFFKSVSATCTFSHTPRIAVESLAAIRDAPGTGLRETACIAAVGTSGAAAHPQTLRREQTSWRWPTASKCHEAERWLSLDT